MRTEEEILSMARKYREGVNAFGTNEKSSRWFELQSETLFSVAKALRSKMPPDEIIACLNDIVKWIDVAPKDTGEIKEKLKDLVDAIDKLKACGAPVHVWYANNAMLDKVISTLKGGDKTTDDHEAR